MLIPVRTHENGELVCCECLHSVPALETFQVHAPDASTSDYPEYICLDCLNESL